MELRVKNRFEHVSLMLHLITDCYAYNIPTDLETGFKHETY